jgi:hypothetical protein
MNDKELFKDPVYLVFDPDPDPDPDTPLEPPFPDREVEPPIFPDEF